MTRFVYAFDHELDDGIDARTLLGGKGAGLAIMTKLGVPVPPGFTISTECCVSFMRDDGVLPAGLEAEVQKSMAELEKKMGRRFGDPRNPLLVSVRSGASVSMPGMMDTILNLGLSEASVEGLAQLTDNPRFAFDAYRRLIAMYGDVVQGVPHDVFEDALRAKKRSLGDMTMPDSALDAKALSELTTTYKTLILKQCGKPFPDDAREQLWGAIRAVFGSWKNPRAQRYRKMQSIPDDLGTAVNIQAMVFGNLGNDSGSGVAFTRNPSTGDKVLYGEFLPNAQGEDVVAGIRTPRPLCADVAAPGKEDETLERSMPDVFAELVRMAENLETHLCDMQDIEFTIENRKCFILQTRSGKRTARAAVTIAVDMVEEGLIDERESLLRVDPQSVGQLLHAQLPSPETLAAQGVVALAQGLPASPGAATGRIVLNADDAERLAGEGQAVILVRRETSPEDIHGMKAARGIVTATGGMTSHAAVVARGLGRCCVAGCSSLQVDYEQNQVFVKDATGKPTVLRPGDTITLDGSRGLVYQGDVEATAASRLPAFDRLMTWADTHRRLRVRTNADTPAAASEARSFGAEGIGLCRTEHMFFADTRLLAVRAMVLAEDAATRELWLAKIEPMQREDFIQIFRAMDGLPVTIRLLDWPLHEFLPREERDFREVADALNLDEQVIRRRAIALHEQNPMLGHRGIRVGITQPEIYQMQVRAIMSAALECRSEGVEAKPEIMLPVVALAAEVRHVRAEVVRIVEGAMGEGAPVLEVPIGTMIELPRACLTADAIAKHADFFSFGTNDLTQTTFGISRDDAGRFLPAYLEHGRGLLDADPFSTLDREGVGALMKMAVDKGKSVRAALKLGLCGEHGGDPQSIGFCEELGLDYISCSPPRLPVARLAAAQAAIRAANGSDNQGWQPVGQLGPGASRMLFSGCDLGLGFADWVSAATESD